MGEIFPRHRIDRVSVQPVKIDIWQFSRYRHVYNAKYDIIAMLCDQRDIR